MAETINEVVSYTVTIAGETCTQQESKGLERVMVQDDSEKIGFCTLEFSGGEIEWSKFEEGKDVEVVVGGSNVKVFAGTITGVRKNWGDSIPTVIVEAMDPLVKLAATSRTGSYNAKDASQSDDQIVKDILGKAGVDAGTIDSSSNKSYIAQLNEPDLKFLKRIAARNGYLLRANEGKVDFVKSGNSDAAVEIPPDQLMDFNSMNDQSQIPSEVEVVGFDYMKKTVVSGSCKSSAVSGIGAGGAKPDSKTFSGKRVVTGVVVRSDAEAKALATSIMEKSAQGRVKGTATIQGNGALHAGKKVKFTGLGEGQNPEAIIVSATHIIEPKVGFRTKLRFKSEGAPE